MNPIAALRRMLGNSDSSAQRLLEIREGIANLAGDVNRRLAQIAAQKADEMQRNEQLLREIRDELAGLTHVVGQISRNDRDPPR
jgi:DnaJ-domain-containing protein 1